MSNEEDFNEITEEERLKLSALIREAIMEGRLSEAKDIIKEMIADIFEAKKAKKRKIIIKVNAKGVRRKKLQCPSGQKLVNGACKPITSKEKLSRKKGLRKAVKTKKAKGAGAARKSLKLRLKARKKRKSQGLK